MIQTAEGATNEVGDMLKRMRELAVQSSSETLNNSERAYIQDEFTQLTAEVDRIADVTEFNGINLGNGDKSSLDVQVGIHNSADDRISITLGDLSADTLKVDSANMKLSTAASAQEAITAIDTAIDSVNKHRSNYGAVQNRLESALNNLETYTENVATAESRIRDADFAHETAEMSKFQIMQQAGTAYPWAGQRSCTGCIATHLDEYIRLKRLMGLVPMGRLWFLGAVFWGLKKSLEYCIPIFRPYLTLNF